MKTPRKVNTVLLIANMTNEERKEKVKTNGVSYRWKILKILKICTFEGENQIENELVSSVTGVLHTLVADGHIAGPSMTSIHGI